MCLCVILEHTASNRREGGSCNGLIAWKLRSLSTCKWSLWNAASIQAALLKRNLVFWKVPKQLQQWSCPVFWQHKRIAQMSFLGQYLSMHTRFCSITNTHKENPTVVGKVCGFVGPNPSQQTNRPLSDTPQSSHFPLFRLLHTEPQQFPHFASSSRDKISKVLASLKTSS